MYMFVDSLEEEILLNPTYIGDRECDTLEIISGYTDVEMIIRHLTKLKDLSEAGKIVRVKRVDLILGMTAGSALTEKKHKRILKMVRQLQQDKKSPQFTCSYIYQGKQVHSKVYIWMKKETPQIAFCGSANYSTQAFKKRRECMTECDAKEAMFYFNQLKKDSILCDEKNIESYISLSGSAALTDELDEFNIENLSWRQYSKKKPVAVIEISLLKADGSDTGYGSGVNWGIRKNKIPRNPNQAYIPYNMKDRVDGFFSDDIDPETNQYPIFRVIPDVGEPFLMRRAQADGKGLHSIESNAIIGEYLRKKLNLKSGEFITKQMMLEYGKTTITFMKYSDDVYLMKY